TASDAVLMMPGTVVNIRPDYAQEFPRQLLVAGRSPRLDEHLQFPLARAASVILERRLERDREVPLLAFRPEPQVHAEYLPLRGHLGNGPGDGMRQADRIFLVRDEGVPLVATGRFAVLRIEEEQIDVRTVVQLVPAQLAERDDAEAAPHNPALR